MRKRIIKWKDNPDINEEFLRMRTSLELGRETITILKPTIEHIDKIYKEFGVVENLEIRVSMSSVDNDILKEWEPNTPTFQERYKALEVAHGLGYKTSVSIEPMLDFNALNLMMAIAPLTTEGVWVGFIPDDETHREDLPTPENKEFLKNILIVKEHWEDSLHFSKSIKKVLS